MRVRPTGSRLRARGASAGRCGNLTGGSRFGMCWCGFEAKAGWPLSNAGAIGKLRHPREPGKVTVAGHPSMELPTGTLKSILKQAGLDRWRRSR
ncbi:MAG: type II toxin-antitoxin system HicA family toxin [Dehalococcoidia bacterium]